MKLRQIIIPTVAAIALLPSCSSDNSNDPQIDGKDTATVSPIPTGPTLTKVEAAPDWEAQANAIPESSFMPYGAETVTMGVPASVATVTKDDIAAVFVGDQCRKAVRPDDNRLFRLIVSKLQTEENASVKFHVRYYSTQKGGYYTSAEMDMVSSGILGSYAAPYYMTWK